MMDSNVMMEGRVLAQQPSSQVAFKLFKLSTMILVVAVIAIMMSLLSLLGGMDLLLLEFVNPTTMMMMKTTTIMILIDPT
jgi:hypothetical protein